MRAIAGSIVILAGSILFGVGVIADVMAKSSRIYVDSVSAFSMGFGAVLVVIGGITYSRRRIHTPSQNPTSRRWIEAILDEYRPLAKRLTLARTATLLAAMIPALLLAAGLRAADPQPVAAGASSSKSTNIISQNVANKENRPPDAGSARKSSQENLNALMAEIQRINEQVRHLRKNLQEEADIAKQAKIQQQIKSLNDQSNKLLLQVRHEAVGDFGPRTGDVQPDRIDFGQVCVSSTVEASVRVFYDAYDTAGISAKVDPPRFVRVKSVSLGTQTVFGNRTISFCDVDISIDTLLGTGVQSGVLRVGIGTLTREIPIHANIIAHTPEQTRVLCVSTPFMSTQNDTIFDPWRKIVRDAKLNVDYWLVGGRQSPLRDADLSKFDVVFLQDDGVVYLQNADIEALHSFIEHGGRVVVFASVFMHGSVGRANELMLPYGMQVVDTERMDRFDIGENDIEADPLTLGVSRVEVHRPTPIVLRLGSSIRNEWRGATQEILVKYPGSAPESREALVAKANIGKGQVVAVGVPLWWAWIATDGGRNSDNGRLLMNILTGRNTSATEVNDEEATKPSAAEQPANKKSTTKPADAHEAEKKKAATTGGQTPAAQIPGSAADDKPDPGVVKGTLVKASDGSRVAGAHVTLCGDASRTAISDFHRLPDSAQ